MSAFISDPGTGKQQTQDDGTLSLVVKGQEITGWQNIRVSRGCERVPMDFDISFTDHFPGESSVIASPGDPCQIKIGGDLVLTGYVDQFIQTLTYAEHSLRILGRSKVEDLVDCSANLPNMMIQGKSMVPLAQELAKPYGVDVTSTAGDGITIPIMYLTLGETVFEIIELMARYNGFLVYDQPDGGLLISKIGTDSMSSGFSQGVNVQSAQIALSMNERFSEYIPHFMSVAAVNAQPGAAAANTMAAETDSGVPRKRTLVVISEQFLYLQGEFLAVLRAKWERARRYGRSQSVKVICDSWRDSAGKLWQPNFKAAVDLPALRLPNTTWVISEISFIRDLGRGTVAEITLMPPEAFTPEPSVIQPSYVYIRDAVQGGSGSQPSPS